MTSDNYQGSNLENFEIWQLRRFNLIAEALFQPYTYKLALFYQLMFSFSLSKLQTLECRENLLQTIPLSLCNIGGLEQLDLGANELDQLPDEIENFKSLHDLWLDGNHLAVLPEVCTKYFCAVLLVIMKFGQTYSWNNP